VSTDSGGARPAISTDAGEAKAATRAEVSTDAAPNPRPGRAPSASACEPYRELIIEALRRGRNAMAIWQDLVDDHGFAARYASVRRFVVTLRGIALPEARVVITTAPGEEGTAREDRLQEDCLLVFHERSRSRLLTGSSLGRKPLVHERGRQPERRLLRAAALLAGLTRRARPARAHPLARVARSRSFDVTPFTAPPVTFANGDRAGFVTGVTA
jgi:hypothetical protein